MKKDGLRNFTNFTTEFVNEMQIFRSSRSQMFYKISVLKNFAVIMEPLSYIKFFYRTPTIPASEFLWQQIDFSC